ncbi:uncharacterized protein LOC125226407 isoform X1 [Leguminivora glycinivorella]|uniref:uncharacterized protein LOC125226407 isoform X1 n=1 Tax=Leguminivora glycinivorella TaxID=1035111 RepID=UPI00200DE4CE|nr:uncharacterized protein LOC125226407 isoform X1 [Leguminivora glycinivorella]
MSQAFNVNLEASLYGSSDEDYSSKNKADIKTVDVCAQPDNTLEDLVIQEEVYEPRKVQSWQRRRKGYYAPRRYESWHGISDKDLEKPTQMEEDDISDTYGLHLHTSVAFEKLGLYFYEPQKLLLVANPNLSKPTSEQKNKLDVKSKLTSETDSVKEISPLDHSIKVFDERFFGFPKESIESKDVVPLDKIGVFETRNLYTTIPNKLSNRTKHKEQLDAKKQLIPGKNDDDAKASTSDNEINKSQFQKLFMKTLNKIYHDALGIPEKRHTTESDLELTTYELEKFERNYMIIFNHENFLSEPKRRGTALDVAALEDTFKQFRFNVTTHNDLKEKDLFTELKKFSRRNFSSSGCLCIAILTHGQDHGYLRAFDTRYCERDVIACFDARINPSLVGKPIIFLIQACRGRQPAAVVESRSQSVQEPVHTVELDAVYPTDKYRRSMDSI